MSKERKKRKKLSTESETLSKDQELNLSDSSESSGDAGDDTLELESGEPQAATSEKTEPSAVIEPKEEPKPKAKAAEPQAQKITLQDAARRFVAGWRDHWLSGLEKFAKNKGFTGTGTQEECKNILVSWGAKLK